MLSSTILKRRYALRCGSAQIGALACAVLLAGAGCGGYWWWNQRAAPSEFANVVTHDVIRGDFRLAITERGEIESAGVTEVRSEVRSKNTTGVAILRIVDEGTRVKQGDFLVELDSSTLVEEQMTKQILVNTARAMVTEAKNLYETAVIAKREYLEGTFIQEVQTIESEAFVAEENLNRAKEYYEYSKKLAAKGYVNKLQLAADKFAVEKSRKELDAANTKLRVLREFTKAKMLKQLESDIIVMKAKWDADQSSLDLELSKLDDITDQIKKCTIDAPKDGTVVFAHETERRGDQDLIVEEGAVIRERQTIIKLPDASVMRVEVKINESQIQYIREGMAALISPVGLDDALFRGTVERVNQYAEPSNWRKANVKEFKAFITVDNLDLMLRSGMTASVSIESEFVASALQIPVQAVYVHEGEFYCFVMNDVRMDVQPISCGPTNDRFIVVNGGLQESDQVVLNPRQYVDQVELPTTVPTQAPAQVGRDALRPRGPRATDRVQEDSGNQRAARV